MAEQPNGDSSNQTRNLRPAPSLEEDRRRYLERLAPDFRRPWRGDGSQQRPPVETLLVEQPPLVDDQEAVFLLLLEEYQAREELGEEPPLEEYQQRFPSHAGRLGQEVSKRRALRPTSTSRPSRLLAE